MLKNSASYTDNLFSLIISTYQNVKTRKMNTFIFLYIICSSIITLFFLMEKQVGMQNFTSTGKRFLNTHTKANCRHTGDGFFYLSKSTLYTPLIAIMSLQYNHLLTCPSPIQTALLDSKAIFFSRVFLGSSTVP